MAKCFLPAAGGRPPWRHGLPALLRATLVVRIPLTEASAKLRDGGPIDDPPDVDLPHWAGIIPLSLVAGDPEPDGPGA